ncbi:MAG: hypothetical protein ACLP1W_12670, partial [Rhodomicrobium sp.]
AWTYRFPARLGADKRAMIEAQPKPVADIAWKAQTRLCARYRALTAKGKKQAVAVTASQRVPRFAMTARFSACGCSADGARR